MPDDVNSSAKSATAPVTWFQSPWMLLLCICALGLAVRLWGIDYGLPHEGITYTQLTYEESKEVHRAFKLGIGEHVWSFGKGGMYLILFFEFGVYYVVSLALGWVSDSREFAMRVMEDRTTAYMIGRVTVAFLGVATCAVIYALGNRLFDRRTGLAAALLGALTYHHVQFSTVINVDIGMVLAMWASVLCYVIYEQDSRLRWLLGSGVLAAVSIAFKLSGVLVVGLLAAAILTAPAGWPNARRVLHEAVVFFIVLVVTMTAIAPEWIPWTVQLLTDYIPVGAGVLPEAAEESDLDKQIFHLTQYRDDRTPVGYLRHLVKDYNLALTIAALAGFAVGIWRKARWAIIVGLFATCFVLGISLSSRPTAERYLLPVLPALWLLAALALTVISRHHRVLFPLGLGLLIAMPTVSLARAGIERRHPDTRLVAKAWIEENIPEGARILMDGMQHRFIPSPPLLPDDVSIDQQIGRAKKQVRQGQQIGRGVSEITLEIYREGLAIAPGPRYEIHSSNHGFALEAPAYYVESCFDYVVTSSMIAGKYGQGMRGRELHPEIAYFYDQLGVDDRFQKIYQVDEEPWANSGPTIAVYRIHHECALPGQ